MEQANYWMWMRRKVNDEKTALVQASSWEEQAFAEDSSGLLGGCVWPPRSYSCSFCRREFRSAQALGGHMNVHRRDRARLKQSPTLQSENSSPTLHLQSPSQVPTLVYNSPNPNSIIPSASRVSLHDKFNNHNSVISPSYSSNMAQDQNQARHSNPVCIKVSGTLSDSKLVAEKKLTTQEIEFGNRGEYPKLNSDESLNLLANLTRETTRCREDDKEIISSKRKKIDTTSLPFFLRPNSVNRHHMPSGVFGINPNSVEEIDLELRLGDSPKVK